jgi:hypothetical protein
MGKKVKIEIKTWTGSVLFSYASKDNSIKRTLERAVNEGAYLRGAYLQDADLQGADLQDAYLRGAYLQDAKNLLPIYDFSNLTILKNQKNKLRAFKFLNGNKSPYNDEKTYQVGKTYTEKKYSTDIFEQCGEGLNVVTIEWCLRDTGKDLTKTYIEVEFSPKDIVAIPFNTDGKFRVKKFKVLRKLYRAELKKYLKPIK